MDHFIFYEIGVDHPIGPEEELPPLPRIPRGSLVILTGRGPIWRYVRAFHLLHGSAAAAVAVYDPRLGAVIVASHSPQYREGQVLDITPPEPSSDIESPCGSNAEQRGGSHAG